MEPNRDLVEERNTSSDETSLVLVPPRRTTSLSPDSRRSRTGSGLGPYSALDTGPSPATTGNRSVTDPGVSAFDGGTGSSSPPTRPSTPDRSGPGSLCPQEGGTTRFPFGSSTVLWGFTVSLIKEYRTDQQKVSVKVSEEGTQWESKIFSA